jgi:uncharacterized protein YggE
MKYLLCMIAILLPWQAFAQMPPPPPPGPMRMISVTGEAHEELAPDQAILTVSLSNRDFNLANAKKQNDAQVEKLVTIARDFKIPKDKIATSNVYISPEYRYDNNRQEFIGYVVSRTFTVTMDDISIHERVLSAIVDAKIDQVNGVQFNLKNSEDIAMKLRAKAVANAKAKADALAGAAGVKVGQAIAISEGSAVMPMPPMPMMAMARDMSEKSSVAPSLPGMISVSQSVSVTFALE